MISIQIGGRTFTAQLDDSESAFNLLQTFPLKITMQGLNGNEKYYLFDRALTSDPATPYKQLHSGDLMIYSGRYLVLFYKTFTQHSYEYVKIGNILDTAGPADAVGNESVEIYWSKE